MEICLYGLNDRRLSADERLVVIASFGSGIFELSHFANMMVNNTE